MLHHFIRTANGKIVENRRHNKSRNVVKIEPLGNNGNIYSVASEYGHRGIICSKKFFPHAETFRMEINNKILCLKVSPSKIHITGNSNLEMGYGAIEWMLYRIEEINTILNHRHLYPVTTMRTINWVLETIKKKAEKIEDDYELKPFLEPEYPPYVDSLMASILFSYASDYQFYSHYLSKIQTFQTIGEPIYSETKHLQSLQLVPCMANYNYSLGYRVNRSILKKEIRSRYGYITRFNNNGDYSVAILIPFPEEKESTSRKKNNYHTFTVHITGRITQCSPSWNHREQAYTNLMTALTEIKPMIILQRERFSKD